MRRPSLLLAALVLAAGLCGCRSQRVCCPASTLPPSSPCTPPPPSPCTIPAPDPCGVGARTLTRSPKVKESFWQELHDDQDGKFDFGKFMERPGGFLPVVIPITEPAVGLGLAGIAAFFHRQDEPGKKGPSGQVIPPSVTAVGGLATENGTWGAFAGHMGVWNDDRIRYTGALFTVSVNLKYYGILSDLGGPPIQFNIEGSGTIQDLQFRLGNLPIFAGLRYQYFNNRVRSDLADRLLPGRPRLEFNSENAGLGLEATLDTRDNIFTPNKGYRAQVVYTFFEPEFGGDFSYQRLDLYGLAWFPLTCNLNLGLRLDGQFVEGDAPFYGLPFVQLRGVPAMRYLGNDVVVGETEMRWDFTKRWSAIGFTGVGRASNDFGDLADKANIGITQTAWNAGGGFRYLVARKQGIRMGIDIARGPEDWAFYVTVGNGWNRL